MRQWYWICLLLVITSCSDDRVFEQNIDCQKHEWHATDVKSFTFDISEEEKNYTWYINVRHSSHYEWMNLWVNIHILYPDGDSTTLRKNLPLSAADGEWLGNCFGDVCQTRIVIEPKVAFPEAGTYTFEIEQLMREDPINHIQSIGLRVEEFNEQ